MTTTRAAATAARDPGAATTSAPFEPIPSRGRPSDGAAAARTAELYARYGRTVSGLCGALLRSRPEAEDATQQTFLSAHRALLNGSEPLEPAAWLATIARNECWSRIRMRMRQPLSGEPVDVVSAEADPLAEAIRRADLAALWQAIESLPRQQRDALLLREFGGLSYGELAAALSVSAPAVESLLFRARQRLRAQLRAVYASVAGASWLETLARAFAGGGAPVAAKVAALGVGAAAVTGGAVVAPDLLERTPPHRAPPTVQPVRHAHPESAPAPPGRAAVVRPVAPAVSTPTTAARRDRGDRGGAASGEETRVAESVRETSGGRSGPDGVDGVDGSGHSGSGDSSSGVTGSGGSGTGGSDSGGSGTGSSGTGSSGTGDSGSGGTGSGGSDDGATATTPTTATVPTETSDGHGDGGGD